VQGAPADKEIGKWEVTPGKAAGRNLEPPPQSPKRTAHPTRGSPLTSRTLVCARRTAPQPTRSRPRPTPPSPTHTERACRPRPVVCRRGGQQGPRHDGGHALPLHLVEDEVEGVLEGQGHRPPVLRQVRGAPVRVLRRRLHQAPPGRPQPEDLRRQRRVQHHVWP
jgi:hypothetical protein